MKRMIKASSTRSTISSLQRRIDDLEIRLSEPDLDEEERIDIGMEIADLREQLNFAWQDDEAEYMYALERQEFNPDGSLKGYDDVESADDINTVQVSQCSFDFVNDGLYNTRELEELVLQAFVDAGVQPIAVDFRSVDYSGYPGYDDRTVSQGGVDFEWSDNYSADAIEEELASALDYAGYDLIGIDFNSLEE